MHGVARGSMNGLSRGGALRVRSLRVVAGSTDGGISEVGRAARGRGRGEGVNQLGFAIHLLQSLCADDGT